MKSTIKLFQELNFLGKAFMTFITVFNVMCFGLLILKLF
jgi:hypothetical protein